LASREQEFRRRELERRGEMERLAATAAVELEVLKRAQRQAATLADCASQVETAAAETLKTRRVLQLERRVIAVERQVQEERFGVEAERKEHQVQLDALDDTMARRRIETANGADAALALVNQLPAIAGALRINELNLTEDTVARLGRGLSEFLTKAAKA